jgi:nitrite reductase/ring-hydroxylating ferredoxin subunit
MAYKTSKRNIFQRLMGKPITVAPADSGCWQLDEETLRIDLSRAPELASPYGAINIEGASLPSRILVLRDDQDQYHALENKCAHGGRHLDPVEGTETVCCCSLGRSIFDYDGRPVNRTDLDPIKVFEVSADGAWLTIDLA